tara:strand:+ start:11780 stop:12532 length:753 start_codon:yes stop_codon:yes gene_type:complete
MKKTLLAFAMLSFLSGCASTENESESSEYMNNPTVQSFIDKQIEVTSEDYQQLNTTVNYNEIILEDPIQNGKFKEKSTTTLFLTNKDYIELLNNLKIKEIHSSTFFVPEVGLGAFSEADNTYYHQSGISRTYISEISENVDENGNSNLEIKNDNVFSGITLKIQFDEKELNGKSKDIANILIHEEKLVSLDEIKVGKDLYIQSPKKEHSSIESTVSFGTDGHFIKYDGENKINVLSLFKKDKEKVKEIKK